MLKNNITRKDTQGKVIFWDIDGVLAPFRFNGKVKYPMETDAGIRDVYAGLYAKRRPTKFMMKVVRTCGARRQIVMGHKVNDKEVKDKRMWLRKYYPQIDHYIWADIGVSKGLVIIKYCKRHNIDLKDVIFVDDTHSILQDAENRGISAWHISSFMDFFEK